MQLRIDTNSNLYKPRPSFSEARLKPLETNGRSFGLHIPLPVVNFDDFEPQIFSDITFGQGSKFFHKILASGGPIDQIPVLDVINPVDDYSDNYKFPEKDGDNCKRLIPKEVLAHRINRTYSTKEFAERFLDGKYPNKIVFKPDASSGANGVLKLKRSGNSINICIMNPTAKGLVSLLDILDYAKSHEGIEIENENSPTITIKIQANDKSKAIDHLSEICRLSLRSRFPKKSDKEFAYTDIQSGFVEKDQNLLKLDGKVIEGRYYFVMQNGRFGLASGYRMDGTATKSYLKKGQGPEFVNASEHHSEWPNMHQQIIDKLGLECSEEEFNYYMYHLLYSQAAKCLENFVNLCDESEKVTENIDYLGFSFDIAWSADETMEVPLILEEGNQSIKVPKPILMETNWELKMKQECETL